ncbi:MAG: hypothetical protein ACNS63_09985 [Candidatus Nitrospinota bacterium M3_3B_026]
MSRKKSIKKSANDFISKIKDLDSFLRESISPMSDEHKSWCHDYAVIRLYREFEQMMLAGIVGAINNDTNTISEVTGVIFPAHLTDEVCQYLILGDGYFDFKGRDGLIKTLKKYVPDDHYLVKIVMKNKYKDTLGRLCALRNYATHESHQSKRAAKSAIGQQRIGSAGSWLKTRDRFPDMAKKLGELAKEVHDSAPY